MSPTQVFILIAVVALAIIAALLVVVGRRRPSARLSPLAAVALALVLSGVAFDSRLASYSLMGAGVLVAVIDIVRRIRL